MKQLISALILLNFLIFMVSCSGPSGARNGEQDVQFEDNQLQEQVENLRESIEDNPNNLEYRRQLAAIYDENGEPIKALEILEKSFVIDPNDAETKFMYAEIAERAGDRAKAYQAYKDVLQSLNGQAYLDRIAPKFTDVFEVRTVVGGSADQAFGNFSPDGNRIIYQSNQNGNWDIFEYDLISETSRQITFSDAHEENPDFAPDGLKIAYTSTADDHRNVSYDQKLRDIYVMDLTSNETINLTTNGSNDWRPRYSNDGKFIAFVSERNDLREVPFYELRSDVIIMESDGRFQLPLTKPDAHDGSPCIAPGSTEQSGTVYFDSNREVNYAIYQMDMKGNDIKRITFNPGVNDVSPAISPNGDKIAFFSDRDGNYEIYMMNTDGSAQQRLTSNPLADVNPTFSPDGSLILFHSNRNGSYDLFLIDLTKQSQDLELYEVVERIDRAIETL